MCEGAFENATATETGEYETDSGIILALQELTNVSRAIRFLKYARKFLSQNTLSKMYGGIAESHFRYCCSVML